MAEIMFSSDCASVSLCVCAQQINQSDSWGVKC